MPKDRTSKITSKGQTTIPKSIRDMLDINDGDEVVFEIKGNEVIIRKKELSSYMESLIKNMRIHQRLTGTDWEPVINRLLKERKEYKSERGN